MEARIRRFEERYGHEDYLALAALEQTQFRVAVLFPYLVALLALGSIATFFVFRHFRKRANAMLAQNMQRLKAAALVDGLTGLGNHRAFREAFDGSGERGGYPCHLALVDIDHFKSFNDRFGHAHGDGVLREVATLLAHEDTRAFRIGGDEFVVMFEGRSTASVLAVLDRIGSGAAKRFRGSLSIGVAERAAHEHIDSVYERADIALYEAKHRGRNTVVVFDSTMIAGTTTIASRRVALERVLAGEQPIEVAFQPIRTFGGETIGHEALARFSHTFATPLEAFAIAARLERTAELDACCIDAIAAAIEPSFEGALYVNVSPTTLATDLALERLENLRVRTDLPPERIVVEVTELEPLRDAARVNVASLRALGYRIALDDTGSGNAGLETLSTMTIDIVKIDRAIVSRLATDETARATADGIVTIARHLGYGVICEGVEDDASMQACRELADRFDPLGHGLAIQGFAVGRPQINGKLTLAREARVVLK